MVILISIIWFACGILAHKAFMNKKFSKAIKDVDELMIYVKQQKGFGDKKIPTEMIEEQEIK